MILDAPTPETNTMKFNLLGLLVLMIPIGLTSLAQAEEINVADHGIVPGEDATYPLLRLIQSVEGESNITLVFPKGTYRFAPDNAVEQFRAVTNHDNSLKRMAFPLFGFKNITIDGGGHFLQENRGPEVAMATIDFMQRYPVN